MITEESLVSEYKIWCELRGYPLKSADELRCELMSMDVYNKLDIEYLTDYIARWGDFFSLNNSEVAK